MIVKIGDLFMDEDLFERFIIEGVLAFKQLRYVYFTSQQFENHPLVEAVNYDKIELYLSQKREYLDYFKNIKFLHNVNEETNFRAKIPKVINSTRDYSPLYDTENLLILFDDIILARSLENSKIEHEKLPIKHGEEIISLVLNDQQDIGQFETLIFIFDQIFDPDFVLESHGLCSFHLFVQHNNIFALDYCLKLGIDINCRTSIGNKNYPGSSALHIAVVNQNLEMVKHLIDQGINPNNQDLNGNTALHLAAAGGYSSIVEYFYSIRVNFIITNKRFLIPMHSSIMGDNIEVFKICKKAAENQIDLAKLEDKERRIYIRNPSLAVRTKDKLTPLMLSVIND